MKNKNAYADAMLHVLGTIKARSFSSDSEPSKSQNGLATILSVLAKLVSNHPESQDGAGAGGRE